MRLRVVCGLVETMATLRPTSEFTNVDFPAFGRPTMAMNPDLKATSPHLRLFVGPALYAGPLHATCNHIHHVTRSPHNNPRCSKPSSIARPQPSAAPSTAVPSSDSLPAPQ